jgi:hypothetical protein
MAKASRLAEHSTPQRCPTCQQTRIKRVALTSLAVYIRCEACGEVWAFSERRTKPREGDPKRVTF